MWYELGYARAAGKETLMVCSAERESGKYPFNIQHRTVVSYTSEAPQDFTALQEKITERLRELSHSDRLLKDRALNQQVAPVAGLSQAAMTVLVAIVSESGTDDGNVSVWSAQQNANKAGQTNMGFALGLRQLKARAFVRVVYEETFAGNDSNALQLTDPAWEWIEANQDLFILKHQEASDFLSTEISSDDIPF